MEYTAIEAGMAIKSNEKIYLVVATDFRINNPAEQSIALYDAEYKRLVYPAIFELMHRNQLWTGEGEIQEIYPKEKVKISID